MPPVTVRCECGEQYHADDRDAGRRLRCRRCGRTVEIRADAARPSAPAAPAGSASAPRARRRRRRSTPVAERLQPYLDRLAGWRPGRRRRPRLRPAARVVTALAWAYLAGACLVAAVMWGLGDRWWPATLLLFMGRWVFLLPLALLVPAALVVRRSLLLPLAAAALVVLGPVMGLRTGWRRALPAPSGPTVRVVSYNVAGDVGGGPAFGLLLPVLLDDWAPDVLAVQECGPQLAATMQQRAGWHHHSALGLCLLSRFPIVDARPMEREMIERVRRGPSGIGGAGLVIRYTLQAPFGPIVFTNLHLATPRQGLQALASSGARLLRLNTELRDVESEMARRWVDAGGGPLIVAGDFNTPVESRIFQSHWGAFTDAFSRAGRGFGMTKHNGWIRARIDHVLAGPQWHVRSATTGPGLGSDHRPVIVELVLAPR